MTVRFKLKNDDIQFYKDPVNSEFIKISNPMIKPFCEHKNHSKSVFCVVREGNYDEILQCWSVDDSQVDLKITEDVDELYFLAYFWQLSSTLRCKKQILAVQILDR